MTKREGRFAASSRVRIAAALVVVAIACLLVVKSRNRDQPADKAAPAPVVVEVSQAVVRPMETVVAAQGTLVPPQGGSARVAAVAAGRLLSVPVKEGQHVSAGQVVATLDYRVQQAQAASAAAALRASRIQAEQAKLALEAATAEQANAVKVARLELQSAETELAKLKRGARPQEIAQADQAVKQAQATYDRAATELDRVKFLCDKGIVAKRELDDATTALAVAGSALETAKEQADLVRAGARAEDLRAAELRVEVATANLEQAHRGSLQVAEKKREAQAANEAVSQKSADLAAAQEAAGYSQLRSPLDGVVVHRFLNPGDMADPSTPVLEINGISRLNMSATVPGEEGGAIRAGMPVRVQAQSAPGRIVAGRVLDVGQIDPQTGLLSLRVSIPAPGPLRAGAFATADIIVSVDPNATVVPKQAVITRETGTVVFVVGKDNIAHLRKVVTGAESAGLVAIVKGVRPGEMVIRLGQYELTDGAKVRPIAR